MVKTRHSLETKDESPSTFLTLEGLESRKLPKNAEDNDNSDDSSGVVHFSPRSLRHQSQKSDKGPSVRSRRGIRRQIIDEEEDTDEADDSPVLQRSQRRRRGCSRTPKVEVEDCNSEVRRSSRQRKLLYGTFDPKILDRALYVDKQNYDDDRPSKRRRQDVDAMNINEEEDMYSRVKRPRKKIKRDMYGMPVPGSESENENEGDENEDEDTDDEENDDDTSDSDDEDEDEDNGEDENEENDKDSDKPQRRSYYLREHKPRTKLFEVPIVERRPRRPTLFTETPESPVRISNKKRVQVYRSPAHRKLNLRRKAAFHGSSSTSSSSSSESSSDEERFQRRKAKSMAKARNQLLPMNLNSKDIANSGILKDRQRIGSSLADVDPMNIDRSIKFESVGGLEKHIRALKEMIVFPLMYPEVFERFKISPPRGVLFYGPPGTGKTLVARALANECSSEEKRVAFFMRKGADCLSKWVGESERQLRLLFDQAYQMRPAIIFFDEIDGLAPIRSSRQDQIHSSIVSTLLALMDGLDSRGEIVVIGATNRIDSIDPALRRPGRFDREFLFPLPSAEARRQILSIHTKDWNPQLSPFFIKEIAEKCVGYCGADIKALCTEAALFALRRRYPQIYTTSEKLQLDVSTINMNAKDFYHAMQNIVPASQRAVASPAKALAGTVLPLLRNTLTQTLSILQGVFPALISQFSATDTSAKSAHEKDGDFLDEFASDEDDDSVPSIYEPKDKRKKRQSHEEGARSFLSFSSNLHKSPSIHRPRLLLAGKVGQGQTTHLAPALLHHFEQLPVHVLDLPTLFAVSANSPEESCSQVFREAMRTSPSIIYMPHINQWWDVLGETFKATLLTLIQDLDPVAPVLILATSELPHAQLDYQLQFLFSSYAGEVHHMTNPTDEERKEFFSDLLLNQASRPPTSRRKAAMRLLEVLPKAPPPEPRKLTEKELKILFDREEATLRELRIFLRDVLNQIFRDRKFHIFARPVDIEDVPDYYEIIKTPMDLSTMMSKIDLQHYQTGKEFQDDIDQICRNALEYNPDKDPAGRAIRHRACALRDTAHAIIKTELDPEFEKQCAEIVASRKRRGEAPGRTAPAFYHTKPLETGSDAKGRFSRRVRGLEVEQLAPLELVEKQWTLEKRSKSDTERSPKRSNETTPATKNCSVSLSKSKDLELRSQSKSAERCRSKTDSVRTPSSSSAHHSRPRKREVWTYRRRRRKSKKRSFAELNSDINDVELFSLDDSDTEPQENTTSEQTLQVQIQSSPQESGALSPHNRPLHSPNRTLSPMQTSNSLSVEIPSDSKPCEEKSLSPSSNRTSCLHKSPDRSSSDKRMISPRSQEQPPNLSAIENCHTTDQGKDNCLPPKLVPAVETDSGISSSVDSNGDSVDSVEHAKQLAAEKLSELPSTSSSTNMNTENLEAEEHDTSQRFRVTRARVQTRDQEKALKLLEAPEQPLIVDQGQLVKLLSDVVISTKNFNIEKLEKLYSMFSQCIFKHKNSYDKTSLVMELEQIHQRYITCTHV